MLARQLSRHCSARIQCAAAVVLCCASGALAVTRHVPADFPTIQAAISAANAFDLIEVAPGVYPEQIDFLGKAITVRGTGGAAVTAIDVNQIGTAVFFQNGEPAAATLEGFTIADGLAVNSDGGGIRILNSSPTIKNCVIISNDAFANICGVEARGGGAFSEGGNPTFINCEFRENRAYPAAICGIPKGGGLYVTSGTVNVTGCTFEENVNFNRDGGGLYAEFAIVNVSDTNFTGNFCTSGYGGAVFMRDLAEVSFTHCQFTSNYAEGGAGGAIASQSAAVLNVTNCEFTLNDTREGGGPGGISIQGGALNVSGSLFLENLAEGGSGGGIGAEDCDIVVTSSHFIENHAQGGAGGGIMLERGTLDITDSSFSGNKASGGYGGGIANGLTSLNTGGTATITNCDFDHNTAGQGGALGFSHGTSTVTDCRFVDNDAPGGSSAAIGARVAALVNVDSCLFVGNGFSQINGGSSAIVGNYEGGTMTLSNCIFNNNSGKGGVVRIYESGTISVINSTFYNCIQDYDHNLIFVYDNSATTLTSMTVANSILRGDTSQGQLMVRKYGANGTLSITNSNISGGYIGAGNINANPLYAGVNGADNIAGTLDDNFAYISGSPGIDAGDNAALPVGITLDFAGLDRIVRGLPGAGPEIVDMGAHEFPGASLCPGDATGDGNVDFNDLNLVIFNWNQSVTPGTGGDIAPDGAPDGVVNFADLNQVISTFDTSCN